MWRFIGVFSIFETFGSTNLRSNELSELRTFRKTTCNCSHSHQLMIYQELQRTVQSFRVIAVWLECRKSSKIGQLLKNLSKHSRQFLIDNFLNPNSIQNGLPIWPTTPCPYCRIFKCFFKEGPRGYRWIICGCMGKQFQMDG